MGSMWGFLLPWGDTHLAFGSRTPNARFNLLMIAPLGIALPDSYSLMTMFFSLTAVASACCDMFLACRACCKDILKSCDTVLCRKVSVFSSSFAAFGTCECADLLPPALIFLSVSTSAPLRRAALTADELLAALPLGAVFVRMTGDQSCWHPAMSDGPAGMALLEEDHDREL